MEIKKPKVWCIKNQKSKIRYETRLKQVSSICHRFFFLWSDMEFCSCQGFREILRMDLFTTRPFTAISARSTKSKHTPLGPYSLVQRKESEMKTAFGVKQGRSHGKSEGASFSCGFSHRARFAPCGLPLFRLRYHFHFTSLPLHSFYSREETMMSQFSQRERSRRQRRW